MALKRATDPLSPGSCGSNYALNCLSIVLISSPLQSLLACCSRGLDPNWFIPSWNDENLFWWDLSKRRGCTLRQKYRDREPTDHRLPWAGRGDSKAAILAIKLMSCKDYSPHYYYYVSFSYCLNKRDFFFPFSAWEQSSAKLACQKWVEIEKSSLSHIQEVALQGSFEFNFFVCDRIPA